jgi:hypothetical protein
VVTRLHAPCSTAFLTSPASCTTRLTTPSGAPRRVRLLTRLTDDRHQAPSSLTRGLTSMWLCSRCLHTMKTLSGRSPGPEDLGLLRCRDQGQGVPRHWHLRELHAHQRQRHLLAGEDAHPVPAQELRQDPGRRRARHHVGGPQERVQYHCRIPRTSDSRLIEFVVALGCCECQHSSQLDHHLADHNHAWLQANHVLHRNAGQLRV